MTRSFVIPASFLSHTHTHVLMLCIGEVQRHVGHDEMTGDQRHCKKKKKDEAELRLSVSLSCKKKKEVKRSKGSNTAASSTVGRASLGHRCYCSTARREDDLFFFISLLNKQSL